MFRKPFPAYCADSVEQDIKTVIEYEKKKFPDEGIKIFVMHEKKIPN